MRIPQPANSLRKIASGRREETVFETEIIVKCFGRTPCSPSDVEESYRPL